MNLLAIDTSTELATVAVMAHGKIYSEEQGSLRQHAQLLLPMIEGLLALASLSFSQLDGIVFGCGPGSFTGLRIACSVAKGLAYAHDLPLYPVSSLAAIAYDVYENEIAPLADVNVLSIIDARMHQVYWGFFTRETFIVQEQVSAAVDITLTTVKPLILAGVGIEHYVAQLSAEITQCIVKQCVKFPKADTMLRLVQQGQINAVNAAEALPVYVRNHVTHGTIKGE